MTSYPQMSSEVFTYSSKHIATYSKSISTLINKPITKNIKSLC